MRVIFVDVKIYVVHICCSHHIHMDVLKIALRIVIFVDAKIITRDGKPRHGFIWVRFNLCHIVVHSIT